LEHATGLEDIKMAIEQLTLRSHGSRTSYSTSTYSSLSGSEGGAEPMRRLIRHSSLETINTNVTVADEFVWVDSYNRLVELQQLPWSNHDVLRVIQNGRIKEHLERVSMETVPRLSYLLQRALVRIARETQRLGRPLAMCSKQEVCSALRIVLSPALADSCIKVSRYNQFLKIAKRQIKSTFYFCVLSHLQACLRAAAMFTVSGDMVRQSKSARAALQLSVGRFHRWMCDVRLGKFIHEYVFFHLFFPIFVRVTVTRLGNICSSSLLYKQLRRCLPGRWPGEFAGRDHDAMHAIRSGNPADGLRPGKRHRQQRRSVGSAPALRSSQRRKDCNGYLLAYWPLLFLLFFFCFLRL
jgi:hypothetical protein